MIHRQLRQDRWSREQLNRPTFPTPPSRISGTRRMLLSRVIATNNTASLGLSTGLAHSKSDNRAGRQDTVGTPAGRIVHSNSPQTGEIDVAVGRDMQAVAASEGLAIAVPQKRADSIPLRIELHEALM